jgi:hypothetical protein
VVLPSTKVSTSAAGSPVSESRAASTGSPLCHELVRTVCCGFTIWL